MNVDPRDSEIIDTLATIEHERWAHWQRYLHSTAIAQPDGSLLLPADLVKRWERQIATTFDQLSSDEKNSDREQVMRYFPLVRDWFERKGR
ncbi:hypothetical protein [Rhizobium leguminosarum]|uniref:hypothetical protein n=1 Tax=Rhizobium leguminosarum TaxID=384 RepID=UPI001C91E58D|nr:hypothetical protein [Rhizobium leguminosarum]MBY2937187.1 hypothetical protein [Rhizobium leguminosarum]